VLNVCRSRRKALMMELMPLVSGPFQPVQSFGSKSSGRLCIMSAPRRWGSFWSVQVLKSFSRV